MGEYNIHKFKLTDTQLNKIKNELENNKSINLTIKNNNFFGSHPLPITSTEKEKIDEGFDIVQVKLSKKKLQFINEHKSGGFLPLLALLPAILSGVAAVGSVDGEAAAITQAVNKKRNDDAIQVEQERHNKEVERG